MKKIFNLFSVILILVSINTNIKGSEVKIIASDGNDDEHFGWSVSISGDYAVISTLNANDGKGAVYIFKREMDDWNEQAKLVASDGAFMDDFGYSVSISGDYVIIGAQEDDDKGTESGSAYIFKRDGSTWTEVAKLTASDGASFDRFGWSVSMSGDYAIVGAINHNSRGAAYIFKREGDDWNLQEKLVASDGADSDLFGYSVSISGNNTIIGAYADNDNGDYSGSAYIFTRNGEDWTEQAKITANDGASNDFFGFSASISNGYAIVGANGDGDNAGSAYIFEQNGSIWVQEAKLIASDGAENNYFGLSVSISGNYACVGAFGNEYSGAAYAYLRSGGTWNETKKITASDVSISDDFGKSVCISDQNAIVGSRYDDNENGTDAGSAYIYHYFDDLTLPVQLSSFVANGCDGQVILDWKTESELENLGFIIYRRKGTYEVYEEISSYLCNPALEGQGNSCDPKSYTFTDENIINCITYWYKLVDVNIHGIHNEHGPISVTLPLIPKEYNLFRNYPNPFNPLTTIEFTLPRSEFVTLNVYSIRGEKITTIISDKLPAGNHKYKFDGRNLASGIYLYRIKAGSFEDIKKMALIR